MQKSDAFIENLYSSSSPDPILTLIRINIDGQLFYYVNNNESITSSVAENVSRVFQPAAFAITLPEDIVEGSPRATLDFDPADNSVVRRLRSANNRIIIDLWLISSNNANVAEYGPANYQSINFNIAQNGISIGLEVEPTLNYSVPSRQFTPSTFPAIWDRAD